jgi:2,4-dienoyl-CoA reductase-like NADH-dependent reductase (Old Yellow Enzyme family)
MTQADIDLVTRQFVDSARLMADAGFSGVELHGAHGYLIGMAPYFYYRPSIWKLTLE